MMNKRESFENFKEGLKKSISASREFAQNSKNTQWLEICMALDAIKRNGEKLEVLGAMSIANTDRIIHAVKMDQNRQNMIAQGKKWNS